MFLDDSEMHLKAVLRTLDLSEEYIFKRSPMELCPFNKDHWIHSKGAVNHRNYCALRQRGYTKEEINSMAPTVESTGTDELRKQSTGSPVCSWELDLEAFSASKQKKMRMVEYQVPEGSSSVEHLALLRDSKRRRQSYRGVHTARRSYTEVLREIIAQQTELLQVANQKQKQQPIQVVDPQVTQRSESTVAAVRQVNPSHRVKATEVRQTDSRRTDRFSRDDRHRSQSRSSPGSTHRTRRRSSRSRERKHHHKHHRSRKRSRQDALH
ncbi:hypothetical protein EG68_00886 [Paragonimus skrjabini miyazakii]|uniref:CHHC U11-48K-type domain-containing protein n=1 Tax=Paragonimus skrjabini miyazakii TaxID=59628 RepID=A0A8S9Z972_9TREM|nr:hypothetical protein EG68_00886 [Paragonimus skrjabini miyazakii]